MPINNLSSCVAIPVVLLNPEDKNTTILQNIATTCSVLQHHIPANLNRLE
jgi:hypothetical protein